MKTYRQARRVAQARAILTAPGVADTVAEALMLHQHECFARHAALHLLTMMELSERGFFSAWVAGAFDA